MTKKKPLTPELLAECTAANAIFLSKKNDLNLTQKKVADAAGISPAAVAQYLNGTNPLNAKFAATLSRLIGEPVEKFSRRLAAEINAMSSAVAASQKSQDISAPATSSHANVVETQQPHRVAKEYPLISWVAAGSWQESCDHFEPGIADEWLASDANAGPHGYWLAVKGASMLPQFTEGMRILVQPEGFDLVSGKFYIAKLLDTGETTFKQYVRDAGLEFLQPLNNQFPTLQITDNVRIIGRVVDAKIAPSLLL